MATIDLGKLAFTFKGTYDNSTAYVPRDVVTFTDGAVLGTYICIANTTGNNPSSGGTAHASWNFMSKSASGIYDGSLSLGSAGDALKVNAAGNALEFGTIEGSVISTVGTTFANWNEITSNLTTNNPTTQNKFLAGPITVTSPAVWTVTGSGTLTII
tara:strand:- start:57 stop:527 length:471 start_codon:yes stop_codon:yes gene_type:complete